MKLLAVYTLATIISFNLNVSASGQELTGDKMIVQAMASGEEQKIDFVEVSDLKVVRILSDDTFGLPHQKLVVKLSSGEEFRVISNMDLCEKFKVNVGDSVDLAGEFIAKPGHLASFIHWVHPDPHRTRKSGHVRVNGVEKCGPNQPNPNK